MEHTISHFNRIALPSEDSQCFVLMETDCRQSEAEDLSIVIFRQVEHVPSGKVAADAKLMDEIAKRGSCELVRITGLGQDAIEAIGPGKEVRMTTLRPTKDAVYSQGF